MNKNAPKFIYGFLAIPVLMFGVLGGFIGLIGKNHDFLGGLLSGLAIGAGICIVMAIGTFGWEWIKKEVGNGKLLPFLVVGFVVATGISGFMALNYGNPSCEDSGDAPYSSCTQYADDGFTTSSDQKWHKFWTTLPVTMIISCLIAIIVRYEMEKNRNK